MRWSNYLTSIEWDLHRAIKAKAKINELFASKQLAVEEAEKRLQFCNEELREVSITQAGFNQIIGELLGERFAFDEEADNWISRHQ